MPQKQPPASTASSTVASQPGASPGAGTRASVVGRDDLRSRFGVPEQRAVLAVALRFQLGDGNEAQRLRS